jgi:hypothetical protein
MDIASIAGTFAAATAAQTQTALAARFAKMNAASEKSIAQLLQAASQNLQKAADAAAGLGQNVDIRA